ncbi:MAG: suppressor of fused domain protein [Paludibacteraceae bacterium]|nr:suppressor of fused domain protein [Paludibacteraceae bacterium]
MKTYSSKNLGDIQTPTYAFPFRSQFHTSFLTLLKSAFKHHFACQPLVQGLQVAVLVFAVFFGLQTGHWRSLFLFLGVTIVLKSTLVFNVYKLYKALGDKAYYRFDKYGISLMTVIDGTQFRYLTEPWRSVEKVYEYSDSIVITFKKEATIAEIVHLTGDGLKEDVKNLLAFWKQVEEGVAIDTTDDYYGEDEIDEIQDFIERRFGEIAMIGHEKKSEGVHIDLAVIEPSEENPYYTIVTIGAGAYRMPLTEEQRIDEVNMEYNEYVMCLPPDWKVLEEGPIKEENWWPIRLLKMVAHSAKDNGDAYLCCETISFEEELEAAKAKSVFLCSPLPNLFRTHYTTKTGRTINFLQLIPVSEEEANHFDSVSATFSEKIKFLLDVDYEEAYDLTTEECEALFTQKIISHFKTLCDLPTEEPIGNNDSRNAAH